MRKKMKHKQLTKKELIARKVYIRCLEELLTDKDFEQIKTSEIILNSGRSPEYFYKYFNDKDNLVDCVLTDFVNVTVKELKVPEDAEEDLHEFVKYIVQHKKMFRKIMDSDYRYEFEDYYVPFFSQDIRRLASKKKRNLSDDDFDMICSYAKKDTCILNQWIHEDNSLSVEDMDKAFIDNRNELNEYLFGSKDQ